MRGQWEAAVPLPGEAAVAGARQVQAAREWLRRVHRLGRWRGAGRGAAVAVLCGQQVGGSHGDGDGAGALPPAVESPASAATLPPLLRLPVRCPSEPFPPSVAVMTY